MLAKARNAESILLRALAIDSMDTEPAEGCAQAQSVVARILLRVQAEFSDRHLPGQDKHRNLIHRRIGHGANDVGRPRSRHKHRSGLAGRAGEPVGQVAGAALVPGQHDLKAGIAGQTHQQRIEPGSR